MLKLPQVTLIGFDSVHPESTLKAMLFSMRQVQFAQAVLVGDSKNPWVSDKAKEYGIELVHGQTTDRADHEYSVLENIGRLFETSHCLFTEWDGAVANPSAWNPKFLDFDFIGAPWVYGSQENLFGEPNPKHAAPVAGPENCVGNGGFSIRSKKFCVEVAKHVDRSNTHQICSDAWMCRTLRPALEKKKIRFASEELAERFSCENRIYSGQFGFHGASTIRLNNWNFDQ